MIHAEVIGDPVAHSKSPLIHCHWLSELGIAADYRKTRVQPGGLGEYFSSRCADAQWRGCNVTLPHKERVGQYCDHVEGIAARIGAVNTIYRDSDRRLIGTNTDVDGIDEAIGAAALLGKGVCLIGAGGAARAALASLGDKGCASVRVMARNQDKAHAAASACDVAIDARPFARGSGALDGAALLINATQLGMAGQEPMPGFVIEELSLLAPDALVFDMVYAPLETELLAAARGSGRPVADGLAMLIGQAAVGFARFFGQPAPRASDAALRRLLTS